MKKSLIINSFILILAVAMIGCGSKRNPGKTYMPDMAYSRAYESYAQRDSNTFTIDAADRGRKIFYNAIPVSGTMKRGEMFPFSLPNDSVGYKMSASIKNPIGNMTAAEMDEAGRLFNIYCGICHGAKGDGNGPLSTSGKVGGVANLTLPNYVSMADGTIFYATEYGKGVMGSYSSQLSRKQRWEIVKYIRTIQGVDEAKAETASVTAKPAVDSTKKVK